VKTVAAGLEGTRLQPQRFTLSLIAGGGTALLLSLAVGLLLGLQILGTPLAARTSLLWSVTSTFLLSLVVTLPFGLILAPLVSWVFRQAGWGFRLVAYLVISGGIAQVVLPYSPEGDRIPYFAFAAVGGLLYFMLESSLLNSNAVRTVFAPERPEGGEH